VVPGEPDNQSKSGLSETGENQVFELARSRLLAGPEKIYHPKEKCCESTADTLAKELYSSSKKMDCLKEVDFDIKEYTEDFLKNEIPKIWQDMDYTTDSGESLREAQKRVSQCIDRLTKAHPDSTIGIVLPPMISILFHTLIVGGVAQLEDWLHLGYASCATYEYSKNGWALVMPPENSFLSQPSKIIDTLPKGIF
jgi:broad specificity phosphatase PhoE